MPSLKDRLIIERDILRSEYADPKNASRSCELFAAMQALSWGIDPKAAATPSLIILAGKIQPFTGNAEG